MPSPLRSALPAAAIALAVLLTACGGSSPDSGSDASDPPTSPKPSVTDGGATISEGARPSKKPTASVVGVRRDDRLNVRASASPSATVVARLAPLAQGIALVGDPKQVGTETWQQVRTGSGRGWVNARYLGYLAAAKDETATVAQAQIAATRVAAARNALMVLVGTRKGVVVRLAPPVVVLDTMGLEDDSVSGVRVRFEVQPGEAGFHVTRATLRSICARGVSDEGLCL